MTCRKGHSAPKNKKRHCVVCAAEGNRRFYLKRLLWLSEFKLAAGCTDCGYRANAAALEFDHLVLRLGGPTVASLVGGSMKALLAEIAQCEIVCSNCHSIRTHDRRVG